MPFKPSVCIDAVFAGQPVSEALEQVRLAGIDTFEFWSWWDKDLPALNRAKDEHGLEVAACCTRFISLVRPDQRSDYVAGLRQSISTATELGCQILISQVGDEVAGVPRAAQHASLVDGLKQSAPILEDAGITLVIEPLNILVDHAGYYLVHSHEAFEIVDEVGSPNVKVVFDIYHQQISEGHLIANTAKGIDKIGHFHAAGNPGRHELTHGEINYPPIVSAIRSTGFDGYLGLEYWPTGDPVTGLREVVNWFA